MTWVVGGNCFNGFVCVADTQATITTPGKANQYFNCVQKIYKVSNNLCVAFCGDIRTGLGIIATLQSLLLNDSTTTYFDIDGHSKGIINFLRAEYRTLNPTTKPPVEFMFLWNAQEESQLQFRPFCMKFKSPNFGINSTKKIGLATMGSGNNSAYHKAISSYLSGATQDTNASKFIFPGQTEAPSILTVEKFKRILFNEASKLNFPGVSKSLIACESVIDYAGLLTDDNHKKLNRLAKELGITQEDVQTANDSSLKIVLDEKSIVAAYENLSQTNAKAAVELSIALTEVVQSIDIEALYKLPKLKFTFVHGEENLDRPDLIDTWHRMQVFLNSKKIKIDDSQATA